MRLFELSSTETQKIIDTDWGKIPGGLISYLRELGYEQIGSGNKSIVYGSESSDTVLKIAISNDPCYVKFVEYCQKNKNNSHLPKIKFIKFFTDTMSNRKLYVVAIEKLEPIYESRKFTNAINIINTYYYKNTYSKSHTISQIKDQFGNSKNFKDYIREHKSFFIELMKIKRMFKNGCHFDITESNIMIRPSTGDFVISDPIFG